MTHENPNEILLYDGECRLCTIAKDIAEKRDTKSHFRFVSTHSDEGKALAERLNLDTRASAYVVGKNGVHEKSDMIHTVLSHLGWPARAVSLVGRIIPKRLADTLYDIVARYRK